MKPIHRRYAEPRREIQAIARTAVDLIGSAGTLFLDGSIDLS